jgi:hypothetical protein
MFQASPSTIIPCEPILNLKFLGQTFDDIRMPSFADVA